MGYIIHQISIIVNILLTVSVLKVSVIDATITGFVEVAFGCLALVKILLPPVIGITYSLIGFWSWGELCELRLEERMRFKLC
jgi:hypothetical protein